MSRYRAPGPISSPYITAEGAAGIRAEIRQLWKIERPEVTAVVHEAAKNGDRSENGDYIYGKRRLREIGPMQSARAAARSPPCLRRRRRRHRESSARPAPRS